MPATGRRSCWRRGSTANAHSFDGLMRAGLGDVAHVLALDLRGRGESDAPPTGYAMEDHARDVIGLLDALDLDRVVMGGHSFGGLLTYWLAANHPERVERCVVLDAPAGVRPDDHGADRAVARPPRPRLRVLGRVPRARSRDAVLRRRRLGRRCRELLPRRRRAALPDGTVQARSRPEHIGEAVERSAAVDWPDVVAPRRAADAPPARSGQLRAARLRRRSSPARTRSATVALMADGTARRRGRKPHHVHVRAGCTGPDRRDRGVSRRGAVVSGRGTGNSGTAGVVRWRWR